jgi:hypothetical protein
MSAAPEKVETTNNVENEEDTTIDIRDIAKMRHIIDVASSRGTFQGKELTIVGELYNKLDNAVKSFEKEMADYKDKQPDIDDSSEVTGSETE